MKASPKAAASRPTEMAGTGARARRPTTIAASTWNQSCRYHGGGAAFGLGLGLLVRSRPLGPCHRQLPRPLGSCANVKRYDLAGMPRHSGADRFCSRRGLKGCRHDTAQPRWRTAMAAKGNDRQIDNIEFPRRRHHPRARGILCAPRFGWTFHRLPGPTYCEFSDGPLDRRVDHPPDQPTAGWVHS